MAADTQERPPIRRVTPKAWLRALQGPSTRLEVGRVLIGPMQAGWKTQPRTGDAYTLTHYLFWAENGPLEMTTDDGTSVLAPKCLAWFSPGVRYSLRTPQTVWLGRFRFRLWKGGALLRMWTQAKPIPGVMRFGEICRLLYEEHRIVAPYADERFRALVAELTISALRAMQQDNDERRLTHYQATRLLDYVSDRVAERTTPAELAALLRLSPAYFARLFRRSFGVSARRWIVEERMRHAARLLLDTDDNVGEIARLLGYNDQHFFSRQFRSVHRLSPMAYRRAHQTEE